MNVKAIDFVVYEVTDIKKAAEFYCEKLGLKPDYINEQADWAEFTIGSNTLALCGPGIQSWGVPYQSPNTSQQSGTSIALSVEDIDQAIDELKQQGVQFITEKQDSSVCYFAILTDPDGNRIWLHQGYADYHFK